MVYLSWRFGVDDGFASEYMGGVVSPARGG